MSFRGLKTILLACGGVAALVAATGAANAGGFAVREQSAWGQGSSYAGVAAGGDLSALFWNPATMTQIPGFQSETVITGIFPYAANSPTAGTYLGLGGTGNTAQSALVPGSYYSYQLKPNLWVGLSVNAPFGLSVKFPGSWAGRDYADGESHLRTYNATPSIAYRVNDWLSVGAGVQIQYADATLNRGVSFFLPQLGGLVPVGDANLSGTGWGYGFTAGVTVMPTPTTTVGLGYRSGLNQKISGSLTTPLGMPSVETTLKLPGVLSLGLRQRIDPRLTLLGTVEWTNWSRIGTSDVTSSGVTITTLPFQYKDGWFFSAGAEYQWSDPLKVRAGIGYEKSPITDDVRTPLLPDNDRFWLSAGGSYQWSPKLSFDLAYSHVFVKSTPINITAASGNPWWLTTGVDYVGTVDSHVDIVSVSMKYRWDAPAPAPVSQLYHK